MKINKMHGIIQINDNYDNKDNILPTTATAVCGIQVPPCK